jgi:hypothetical protein
MAPPKPQRLFALDQNFPEPIVDCLTTYLTRSQLVPIRRVREDLPTLADWQVMVELCRHERAWDGLVTNDDKLLALPKEMTVLSQTGLTLVSVRSQGHNPIRATGVLLSHIDHICHHTTPHEAQIWVLGVSQKQAESPADRLERIARNEKTTVARIMAAHAISSDELRRRP